MKKIAIAIVLFCTLSSAYSLDYRQVIFGNSYQNIIEIDADAFFKEYSAVKEFPLGTTTGGTTRVYKQIIGENTFYRVVLSDEKLTDTDFLDWKNLEFDQVLFFKTSNTHLRQLGDYNAFKHIDYDDNPVYTGLEIIERNNQVIGIMEFALSESDSSNNEARYTSWPEDIFGQATTRIVITASNSLVDSKRPFMYTIQNAFDGNPATSYVEDTFNDRFSFEIEMHGRNYDDYPKWTSCMIINGYASGDYYYQNNQIAKVAVGTFELGADDLDEFYPYGSFQLHDTVKPQVMSFDSIPMERSPRMYLQELTKGTKYNDTAMAEFDIYIEDEGWVFGSSDTDTIIALPVIVYEYEYTIKDDGTAEIKRYNGEATELTIPSIIEYEGKNYTLTSIGDSALEDCTKLTSVTIPDSVTSVGRRAFSGCSSLTTITIPDSVTSIGSSLFSRCYNLTSVTISNNVTAIDGIFFECFSLTSVTLPNSLTSIGDATFMYCSRLTSITIPDSVTSIGDWGFYGTGLISITIPSNVTSIGEGAFNYCETLTVSVYPNSYALEYIQENDIPYILIN